MWRPDPQFDGCSSIERAAFRIGITLTICPCRCPHIDLGQFVIRGRHLSHGAFADGDGRTALVVG